MSHAPCKTIGVEVELLAPVGGDRRQLAEYIAARVGGSVRPCFHIDSEPSKVKGKPIFYHLTQAFEVRDADDQLLVTCLDDITLQRDLNKSAKPKPGWYRILSDDVRLLRLLERHTDASATIEQCLAPLGTLFGTQPQTTPQGVYRLIDEWNASLAMAAPLPGERERPCELVTAPLAAEDRTTLPLLLGCAAELGFTLPNEGATHLHFDGKPFCSASGLVVTMNLLHAQRDTLRELVISNPYCRRLGPWPDALVEAVNQPDFLQLDWDQARQRLLALKPSKYVDFNIRNLANNLQHKHTLEIRNLPATLDSSRIFAAIDAFQALFAHTLNQHQPTDNRGQPCGYRDQQQLPPAVVAAFQTPANHLAQPIAQKP